MTANGHAANGADAPSKMPHKPWRDDEEDANSLRAIVRANFPRSVDDAFPFLRVARTMTRDDLKNDLVAGLTVAVMVIPQGMAYAALASLHPEIGLYSCILPILTYALVGSSRQLAVGPVAMVALLTTAGLSPIQDPLEDPVRYQRLASTLAFLVGIMQAGMGLLRLEFIARFLPHPVLSGFTSAAAVVIGSSQIKDGEFLFGYFWLFLVIFGYFRMGNVNDGVFCLLQCSRSKSDEANGSRKSWKTSCTTSKTRTGSPSPSRRPRSYSSSRRGTPSDGSSPSKCSQRRSCW